MLLRLALRNVFRHKLRTGMTLGAIAFGVVGLIISGGFVQDVYQKLGEALIHSQSGHLQISRVGYYAHGTRSPEKFMIDDSDSVKRLVLKLPQVQDVMARISFSGLLSNGRSDWPVVGEGVEPDREAKLGTFVSMTAGRQLTNKDSFGAVIGAGVAQALKLKPGDDITLLANALEGAQNTVELKVIGVFQSFSRDYDDRAVKIPLAAAQDLLGTSATNSLVVSLKRTMDTDDVAALLNNQLRPTGLEVRTWIQLNDFYEKTVQLYERQFGVLLVIVLIMVVLSVANTVYMSVFERLGEFGTMMSLGDRRRRVYRLILTESILLGVIGSLIGLVTGVLLALGISAIGIPMPPPPASNVGYTAEIMIVPVTLLLAFTVGVTATVVAALWPARRVSRTPVIEALRANV
jgi:putative ABC transport system permease protein